MIYKRGNDLIEAKSLAEAISIFGAEDGIRAYRKPSEKAFMMWCWLRCGRKDGKLIKISMGEPAPFIDEYREDPNIVLRELREAGVRLGDWVSMGDPDYDYDRHEELFYRKEWRS